MNESKQQAWWVPGLTLFIKVSAWIAFPIIVALYLGRYLDTYFNTGSSKWFFICVTIAFFTTMIAIGRITMIHLKKANLELQKIEEDKAKGLNTKI